MAEAPATRIVARSATAWDAREARCLIEPHTHRPHLPAGTTSAAGGTRTASPGTADGEADLGEAEGVRQRERHVGPSHAACATAGMLACVAERATRPIRNREAPATTRA